MGMGGATNRAVRWPGDPHSEKRDKRVQVLVTGATGFVGRAVIGRLLAVGHGVIAATRRPHSGPNNGHVRWQQVGDIDGTTDWAETLAGVEAVIHLAARTHRPGETHRQAHAAYRSVNVEGTRRLATQARQAGVRRLVFVSSVKAQAERSERPLREDDRPYPEDIYGITKLEAESALKADLNGGPTAYTIVRPPLVYGPGVQANLESLARAALAGWPLPFAWVENRRSLIGVDNLADLLVHALAHPAAADRLFLASDGQDLSLPDLVRRISRVGGRSARLFPVPPSWLRAGLRLAGRAGLADRLLGSLFVDSGRVRADLDWTPPVALDSGLAAMVAELTSSRGHAAD